jgi:hypothetical protein
LKETNDAGCKKAGRLQYRLRAHNKAMKVAAEQQLYGYLSAVMLARAENRSQLWSCCHLVAARIESEVRPDFAGPLAILRRHALTATPQF